MLAGCFLFWRRSQILGELESSGTKVERIMEKVEPAATKVEQPPEKVEQLRPKVESTWRIRKFRHKSRTDHGKSGTRRN